MDVVHGWVGQSGRIFWMDGGTWIFFMGEWRWVRASGSIFWVGGEGWTFFMGGWEWVE